MIKQIIKDSIEFLLSKPKLIRLAFLTTFGHTIYRTYFVAYFLNDIVRRRYESGIDTSDALIYMVNKIQDLNIWGFIIGFLFIIIVGAFLLYPIGEASIIYYIQNPEKKLSTAIYKGIKKFFVMIEFNGLFSYGLGLYTVITFTIRFWVMGILESSILKIIFVMWRIIILFGTFFRPYIKYYLVTQNVGVFDAMRKSVNLSMHNLGLTIKGVLFEMLLFGRFILNAVIIIAIPFLLVYVAVYFNIIDNAWVEGTIRILTAIMILLISYINAIFEAFFTHYRYKLFQKAEKNLQEE
jgi:hypothetical protein